MRSQCGPEGKINTKDRKRSLKRGGLSGIKGVQGFVLMSLRRPQVTALWTVTGVCSLLSTIQITDTLQGADEGRVSGPF